MKQKNNSTIIGNVCRFILGFLLSFNYHDLSAAVNFSSDTLAVIGKEIITDQIFVERYKEKIIRLGLTDTYDARRKYLHNLVDDEILILNAKQLGLDKSEEARLERNRIETQELLNSYSLKHLSSAIKITDDDLKDLFLKLNTKLKVSHIYASNKEEADSLYKEILNGGDFNKIAQSTFHDPSLKESMGSLGYISVDEMDRNFEDVVYSLKISEISAPVKTVQGYSIIRLDDIKRNPFVTENEYLKMASKLRGLARKRAYEELVKNYTQSLRAKLKISFNNEALQYLYKEFSRNRNVLLHQQNTIQFEYKRNTQIVNSTFTSWDLAKVIHELQRTKQKQLNWIRTAENLEDFLAGLIMREYIVKEAKKENLNLAPSFKQNVKFNFDSYLLTAMEDKIQKNINISADSLKSYYLRNNYLFKSEVELRLSSILLDRQSAADSIKKMLEAGQQFEDISRKYSIQKITANTGGDLGFFTKKELGAIGGEVFSLSVGQWSGPFIDEGKYLFLKCTDKKESVIKSFDEASSDIKKVLTSMEMFSKRSEYAQSLRTKIKCKVFEKMLTQIKI